MNREEAISLINSKIQNKNLIKHMLATEVCMGALAKHFNEDIEKWKMAGLLHDLDYSETYKNFPQHGFITESILKEYNISPEIIYSIKAHPGHVDRKSKMDYALYAVDPLTGLIVAATLMHPSKSLSKVDTEFVLKRFKEKRFAAGANREQISSCKELDLSLEEFISICLKAMQEISSSLGL